MRSNNGTINYYNNIKLCENLKNMIYEAFITNRLACH